MALPPNMNSVLEQLSEKDAPNRIPLSIFKANIHHFVSSDETTNLKYWRRIAGGYSRNVHVVDDETGELVYDVPSMIRPYDISNVLSEKGMTMSDALIESRRVSEINPERGRAILKGAFEMKFGELLTVDENAVAVWEKILTDFGYDIENGNSENRTNDAHGLDNGFDFE